MTLENDIFFRDLLPHREKNRISRWASFALPTSTLPEYKTCCKLTSRASAFEQFEYITHELVHSTMAHQKVTLNDDTPRGLRSPSPVSPIDGTSETVLSAKSDSKSARHEESSLTFSGRKRSKTFTGCYTCRARKIRCDLGRPECQKCIKSRLTCRGYDINLRWSHPIKFSAITGNAIGSLGVFQNTQHDENDDAEDGPNISHFHRRHVGFVNWETKSSHAPYRYYHDMDTDLSILHNSTADPMIMKNKTKILGPFGVFQSANGMKDEALTRSEGSPTNKASPSRKLMTKNNSRSIETESAGPKKSKPNDSIFGGSPLGAMPLQVAPHDQLWLSNELRDDALLTAAALNGDTQFLDFMSTLSTPNSSVFTPVNANNYSYNTNQSEFLNLVFHRNSNHGQHSSAVNLNDLQLGTSVPPNNISMLLNNLTDQQLFERSHQAAAAAVAAATSITPTGSPMHTLQDGPSITSHAHSQNVQAQGQHENMQYSNYSDYYYNNPYKQNESLEIHLDASAKHSYKVDDNETNTDLVDGEQGNATTMPPSIMRTVESHLEPELGFEITIPPQESQDSKEADHMGKVPPGLPSTALQVQPLTRYLLNYYVNQVADLMTVIPLTENPWKSIYFPRALMAIGELLALGHTSDAKNALLNALLAVSAFNLQSKFPKNSPPMKFYLNLGIRLRNQASVFVKKLLNSSGGIESCVRNEKYKDVLCAVMSMISVDLVWGTMQDTNYYISWCGKVISLKMVNKKKLSSKARILHRIFSSLKLIQDLTCLDIENIKRDHEMYYDVNGDQFGGDGRQRRNNTAQSSALLVGTSSDKNKIDYILSAAKSEANKHGARLAAATIPPTTNRKAASPSFLNKKLINIKKNDENFATDALYGLPNSLIILFGGIVRILRTKLYHRKTNSPLPNTYEREVDAINETLKSWDLDWVLYEGDKKFISLMHEVTYHHIMSFYHALNIYFSKLVLDIPGLQLQESVEQTLDHLNAIQLLISRGEAVIIPLFWQGFIAGCEAISQELQMGFKKWGADIAQYLGSYWGARQIMLEVWRRKRMREEKDDWVSVIQDWEMNLMLN